MPSQKRAKAKRREQRAYQQALAQQLRYIDRSCQIFDQGHGDEAIRIATQLRVILHQGSGKYKSLLQHLGTQKGTRLLSTCERNVGPDAVMYHGMGQMQYKSDGETVEMTYYPSLGDVPNMVELPVHEWWNQVVWVDTPVNAPKVVLRRKDVILAAANKDGGAHFDELTPEYGHLATPGVAGSFTYTEAGARRFIPIPGTHFVCLRQMGYEILHSPGLIALLPEAA
jgi:hypothetical protein